MISVLMSITVLSALILCLLPSIVLIAVLVLFLLPRRLDAATHILGKLRRGQYRGDRRLTRRLMLSIAISTIALAAVCLLLGLGLVNLLFPSLLGNVGRSALGILTIITLLIVIGVTPVVALLLSRMLDR